MRNEPDLPPELAAVETQLRALSLPASQINREQLFYQAGFAAARANVTPTTRLLWPVTSGALAAAVILLAVLVARTPITIDTVAETTEDLSAQRIVAEPLLEHHRRTDRRGLKRAPLLALREQALRGELPEPLLFVSLHTPAVPTSAREILRDFFPETQRRGSP